ncbi:MAG: metalloregulator ArsR/SmtB family transcription factor [Anaerolineae bacterium]|nr:metalloregulator ArsR/SmtB family transcription factor [Anaerolineae bacterium]
MRSEPDLSTIAALIGDPTRAIMLSALLGGQSLPASELAYRSHITAQTASSHLSKLVEGGLLTMQRTGRHHYYQLKNAEVAHLLEALAVVAPPPRVKTQEQSNELSALQLARTCYDHLAGKLGVAVTQSLIEQQLITLDETDYQVTAAGSKWLSAWEIDESQLHKGRRKFACTCLDWSERRYHVAGAFGASVTTKFFEKGWIARMNGTRAIGITDSGHKGLKEQFGIETREWV